MNHKPSILIVEDNAMVAVEIKQSLTKMDYLVADIVNKYDDALQSIKTTKPDIILIDIDLKRDKTGIDLAKVVQHNHHIPFIYLTSNEDDETMEKAIETFPVAYLSKPFRREELKSNLLLAFKSSEHKLIQLPNGYSYDPVTYDIYQELPIYLSKNEKVLLKTIIKARGNITPYHVIESHIWGNHPPAENALRDLKRRLQTKLKDLPIETIRGMGYRLLLES